MNDLSGLSSDELIAALLRLGFIVLRRYRRGTTLQHPSDLRQVTIEDESEMSDTHVMVAVLVSRVSHEDLMRALLANQKASGTRCARGLNAVGDDDPQDAKQTA